MLRAIMSAGLAAITSCAAFAQTAEESPRFEVLSVKPTGSIATSGNGAISPVRGIRVSHNRLTCNLPLKALVGEAFSLPYWLIVAPEWTMDEAYEINAILPPEPRPLDLRPMLQSMLADRFGLEFHREHKVIPVYTLIVGRRGFKLHEAPGSSRRSGLSHPGGLYRFTASSMQNLAEALPPVAGRPVLDLTGIKGVFDFELKWAPDRVGESSNGWHEDRGVFAALEEQLGLKLEPRKMPYEILVVDRVMKTPTEN